jgi:predicted 3-demethylubiquinone-9 3-methyltransferase (glyoxalase superfamily)
LWFDGNAEEAVKYYTRIFKKAKIVRTSRYPEEGYEIHGMKAGKVLMIEFELNGQKFAALNAGPQFKFNEAVSFQVYCKDQKEIDYYWEKLSQGGDKRAQQCGWLKDKFGLSWQIVPAEMPKMWADQDTTKTNRLMKAMLQNMKKLNIKMLRRAFEGK